MNPLLYCSQYTFISAFIEPFDVFVSHVTLRVYTYALVASTLQFLFVDLFYLPL